MEKYYNEVDELKATDSIKDIFPFSAFFKDVENQIFTGDFEIDKRNVDGCIK